MARIRPFAALPVVFAAALGACVTSPAAAKCTVNGAEFLSSGESADVICSRFSEHLAQANSAGENILDDLSIVISLTKRGSAQALITSEAGAYPLVAVDVMDRPLQPRDIDALADAVSSMLDSSKPGS